MIFQPIILQSLLLLTAQCIDLDQDSICQPYDCNDQDPSRFYIEHFYLDEDHDGYGTGPIIQEECWGRGGYFIYPLDERSFNNLDCNDLDDSINPRALELPNDGVDQNCDGLD